MNLAIHTEEFFAVFFGSASFVLWIAACRLFQRPPQRLP
jgi:hypothetical protein